MNNNLIHAIIFIIVFVAHFNSIVRTSGGDSKYVLYTSLSIIREGNTDLDEYAEIIPPFDYRIEKVNGHIYTIYPMGLPILGIPFIYISNMVSPSVFSNSVSSLSYIPKFEILEVFIACLAVALTSIFIYLISLFRVLLRIGG